MSPTWPAHIRGQQHRKDGSSYTVEINNQFIPSHGGRFVSFLHDITGRKAAAEEIKRQLSEKETLLKEVHHRIKNNMNAVIGIMHLQSAALKDLSAIEAINDARSRVSSMMVLYDKLYRSDDFKNISFKEYITPLIDEIIDIFPNKSIVKMRKSIDDFMLDARKISHIGIIINELLTNTMKHAFEGKEAGLITMSAAVKDNRVTIAVHNDGHAISESIDIATSNGFGLQLIDMMTRQLRGTIRIERDNGTKFILEFGL